LDDMCINKDFQITSYLQEFQYGKETVQTTTTVKRNLLKIIQHT